MIKVTMELWPFGEEKYKTHLGTAIIGNDATGTVTSGNYNITLSKAGKGMEDAVWKRGRVEGFKRKKKLAWDLLYLALRDIVGDRNE